MRCFYVKLAANRADERVKAFVMLIREANATPAKAH